MQEFGENLGGTLKRVAPWPGGAGALGHYGRKYLGQIELP
jgi:hypothetical protein